MPSPHSEPVNDTLWNRIFTVGLYHFLKLPLVRAIRGQGSTAAYGRIVYVSSKLAIKSDTDLTLAEANAMVFVANNTSIPVPAVYSAFKYHGRTYMLMERKPGRPLAFAWLGLADDSKKRILSQLRGMVSQLRALKPPPQRPETVCNGDGGPVYDPRLALNLATRINFYGPFATVDDFHRYGLRDGFEVGDLDETRKPGVDDMIRLHHAYRQELTESGEPTYDSSLVAFTHGDLSSFNVLIDGDEVTAIIDWETAGWWPVYWEYTSAWHVNPGNLFWQDQVDHFITPRPNDLAMEKERRRYFGQFGYE